MIACVGALTQEIAVARSLINGQPVDAGPARRIYRGNYDGIPILMIQTGVGRAPAQASLQFALGRYPISAILSFGLGGALQDAFAVGDLFLVSSLSACEGPDDVPDRPSYPVLPVERALLAQAWRILDAAGIPHTCGGLTSSQKLIADPRDKRALAQSASACLIDMESYWIAEIAAARRLPALFVRAVSDGVEDRLPPFGDFLSPDGRWMILRALSYFMTHPSDVKSLKRLSRNSRKACASLSGAFPHLIAAMADARKAMP